MPVTFLDPRAEPGMSIDPYTLGVDITAGPVSIAMLANGFPDSVNFLVEIEAVLSERLPGATFVRYDKGDASSQVSPAMADDIAALHQALITAYGH